MEWLDVYVSSVCKFVHVYKIYLKRNRNRKRRQSFRHSTVLRLIKWKSHIGLWPNQITAYCFNGFEIQPNVYKAWILDWMLAECTRQRRMLVCNKRWNILERRREKELCGFSLTNQFRRNDIYHIGPITFLNERKKNLFELVFVRNDIFHQSKCK